MRPGLCVLTGWLVVTGGFTLATFDFRWLIAYTMAVPLGAAAGRFDRWWRDRNA